MKDLLQLLINLASQLIYIHFQTDAFKPLKVSEFL